MLSLTFVASLQCCQWICLDDIHPHGGSNFDPDSVGDGGGGGSGAADVKLRLVAAAVTAIFSIALLFFLVYRLVTVMTIHTKLRNTVN